MDDAATERSRADGPVIIPVIIPAIITAIITAIIAAIISVSIAFGAGTAAAHATLIKTTPEDGAHLDDEPQAVSFKFNQEVRTPAHIAVTAPDGTRVDSGKPEIDDDTVKQQVKHAKQSGKYSASYRVVSSDGHPVDGTITYHVAEGASPSAGAKDDKPSSNASVFDRFGTQMLWGLGAIILAVVLLLLPRRRKHG